MGWRPPQTDELGAFPIVRSPPARSTGFARTRRWLMS